MPGAGLLHHNRGARICQQTALCGHQAGHTALVTGGRQQRIVGAFQPGSTVALAVEIAQQVRGHRAGEVPRYHPTLDALGRQVSVNLHQKRRGKVAALIEQALVFIADIGKKRRIPGLPGHTQGVIPGCGSGQSAAVAVKKITAGTGQRQRLDSLPACAGRVGCLPPHPVGTAEHNPCQHHQRRAHPKKPSQGHCRHPQRKYGPRGG